MPRLLVVTPTTGRSPHLQATCESVRALGETACHVIVGPVRARGSAEKSAPGSRYVVEETSDGLYAALNLTLAGETAGEVFTYINDDDLLCASGIATSLEEMRVSGADVVFGRVSLVGAHDESLGWLPVARRAGDLGALLSRGIIPFAQPGTLVRRSLVDRLGGFDASYRSAGDLDFFVRALVAGARFAFVDRDVAAFRLHAGQLSKNEALAAQEKERALAPLRARAVAGARGALLRFRLANLGAYLGRIRRFGWARMSEVYRHR